MVIVELRMELELALADFLEEFRAAGEERIPAFLPNPGWSFSEMVDGFERQSRGEGLPDGRVPGTTRFLADGDRILGVFNVRHRLTDGLLHWGGHIGYSVRPSERGKGYATMLLRSALDLARELGIERALVTCDPANAASARVIGKCGGVFEDCRHHEPAGSDVARYWIATG